MAIIRGNPGSAAISSADIHAALLVLMEAARAPGLSLTKRDLIRAIIVSANEGKLRPPIGTPIEINGQAFFPVEELLRCADLRGELAAIIHGSLPTSTKAALRRMARQMAMVPTTKGAVRFFPIDAAAVLSYGLTLLQDESEWQGDLKQCQFPGCGKFFLASDQVNDPSEPGRRLYRYCAEHTGKKTAGAIRQREWRKRQKAIKATAVPKHK